MFLKEISRRQNKIKVELGYGGKEIGVGRAPWGIPNESTSLDFDAFDLGRL